MYNGYKLQISAEKDGNLLLYSSDLVVANTLKMEQTDKFSFNKWVVKNQIEKIWEQKEPLWGFDSYMQY
jgi:hypothetical protein